MPLQEGMAGKSPCPHLGKLYQPLQQPQLENPYPLYALARSEEPVFFSEEYEAWVVTRYDDLYAVLAHPELFSSENEKTLPAVPLTSEVQAVLQQGYGLFPTLGPMHYEDRGRIRRAFNKALAPARLVTFTQMIQELADRSMHAFAPLGSIEVIEHFALPFAQEVLLRIIGIPDQDLRQCQQWCDAAHALVSLPLSPPEQLTCAHSVVAFQHYLANLLEVRLRQPAAAQHDLFTCFQLLPEPTLHPLGTAEMVKATLEVIFAGTMPVVNVLGNALYHLLVQPERWQHLRFHLEDLPRAIEEVLRFDAAVHACLRTAKQATNIGEIRVPQGATLLLVFGAANRDEAKFAHSEQFDLRRSPNRHLAFGYGDHVCVGAPLARLETRIALESLLQQYPALHLSSAQPYTRIHTTLQWRGFTALHLEWPVFAPSGRSWFLAPR